LISISKISKIPRTRSKGITINPLIASVEIRKQIVSVFNRKIILSSLTEMSLQDALPFASEMNTAQQDQE